MQSLMSNLLASAAGKESACPPCRKSNFHVESFIMPGDYRRDVPSSGPSQDDEEKDSNPVHLYSPTSNNTPSYIPCYDVHGYSSSPTYVRGEFYHLTPPTTPELEKTHSETSSVSSSKKGTHKFSIDSILRNQTSATVIEDSSAKVYSALTAESTACASGQFRFSMSDWSVFQPSSRTTSRKAASEVSTLKPVYWCHVCDMFCSSEEESRRHQEVHRSNGDSCKLQQKFFSTHGYVSEHKETDYFSRVKCGLCDKVVTNCFFGKHMRRHTAHVCDVCGHESSSNSQLRSHMNSHIGHKLYRCRICERAFGDKAQMIRHEQMHVEDRNQCRFCRKSFSSKYSRVVHERIHTGQNPYTCSFPGCDRSFPQKVQLRLHQNHHF